MKKASILLFTVIAFSALHAQNSNNICVWNAITTYNSGGGPSDLERGIPCSDEAIVHDGTSNIWKTWFYRGEMYTLVFMDTVLNKKYGNAALDAAKSFKKLYDLNDPKFKQWDEAGKYIDALATNIFNAGVDQFQAKNYTMAYQYFYAIKDIDSVLAGKKMDVKIDVATALKNAAISAENAGDVDGAIKVFKDWLAIKPEASAYQAYVQALKKKGLKDDAEKVLDEGLTKFPDDANLLVEKINTYLENTQYTEALKYVNNLLRVEPKNDGAMFIKGLAYEKIGNEDSVVYYYTKAAELNPKNIKPWNNLGALYVNKANAIITEMNKLTTSAEDTKKYDELQKQRKELYVKAKPYLEKAHELDPDDAQINRTLKQIQMYTAE